MPSASADSARRPATAPQASFGVMDVVWFFPRLLFRLFVPKLVDRYVIGEFVGPLLFGWTLFIVLFVFSLNLFKLAQLMAQGARPEAVGEMLLLRVVLASVYCIPMATLLAGLMAFGRLSGDSELIATQAGGISNLRIMRNVFAMGLALSFLGLAVNEYVIPPAGKRLHFLEQQVKLEIRGVVADALSDQKAFVIQDVEGGKLSRVVVARKFEPEEGDRPAVLRDVTYIQYDKGLWSEIVSAERAEWLSAGRWRFFNSDVQFRHTVTNEQRVNWQQQTLDLKLNKSPQQVAREQKDADQMSYRELELYIRDMRRQGTKKKVIRDFEVELERKLSVPFAALVLGLVGAPLGIRRQRSTAGVGIGLSLLIIILYYMGMSFLGVMGQSGQLGPREAAWGCNVVALIVGLYLTWRTSR